ncbi:MAG: FtsX-like permease family protein [Clostridiales bacterium]|nr:FtsX-like permease family protein [Clostridiales bacterium]
MNIKENIRIAIFSIRTNMMRSLLTMLGIIIGVASVLAIVTIGNGGRDYIVDMIRDMGSNTVSINVNTVTATPSEFITDEDIKEIKSLETVKYASPFVFSIGNAQTDKAQTMSVALSGTTDFSKVMNTPVKFGRFFNQDEYDASRPVTLVDTMTAYTMFGYENCVGQYVDFSLNNKSVRLKVIGVFDLTTMMGSATSSLGGGSNPLGSFSAMPTSILIMPGSVVNALMDSQGYYEMCYLMADKDENLDSAGNAALNVLYSRHNNGGSENYSVVNMATFIDLLDSVIKIFTLFVAGVSAISLLVGGIGVMNIMLVSVTERTREIGIRKALGAKTSTILFQFLTESVILCVIGGVVGLVIGVSGSLLVSEYMEIPMDIRFFTVAVAIGFSSVIGIFFGIYPAQRAAKMPPIEALRRE